MRYKKILAMAIVAIMGIGIISPKSYKANATEDRKAKAKEIVSKMTLEEKVGQVLMPAISYFEREASGSSKPTYDIINSSVPEEVEDFLKKYNVGGLILFGGNFKDIKSTVSLTYDLHKVNKEYPLLLAVDQEGGGVTRIAGSTYMNGNMALAAAGDLEATKKAGGVIGTETAAVGIDITFAPVLDVYINPTNTVIGTRSFGDNPETVAKHGVSFIDGVQGCGVSAGAKHFPGNGDSTVDTHADLNVNNHDLKTLEAIDLKPFRAAVDSGVDVIMTSHSAYPGLDDSTIYSELRDDKVNTSATFSKKIITDTLKKDMGFDGVVVTDAMDMQALTKYFNQVDATLLALEAGCDIILMPFPIYGTKSIKEFETYFSGVVNGIKSGKVSEERIDDAVTRIIELKIKRGLIGGEESKSKVELQDSAQKIVGSKAHKEIEREIAEKAVTVVKNEDNMLPMKLENDKTVTVIDYYTSITFPGGNRQSFSFGNKAVGEGLEKIKLEQKYQKLMIDKAPIIFEGDQRGVRLQSSISDIKAKMDKSDYIIFAPYQYDTGAVFAPQLFLPEEAKLIISELIDYANSTNKQYAYIDIKDPYDAAYLPQVKNMITAYANVGGDMVSGADYREVANVEMAVRAAFGLIDTTGKLPVDIKKGNDKNIVYSYGTGHELKKITEGYTYVSKVVFEDKGVTSLNITLGIGVIALIGVIVFISRKKEYLD